MASKVKPKKVNFKRSDGTKVSFTAYKKISEAISKIKRGR